MNVANKIEMRAMNTVRPYARNPRKNDKTVDALVDLIPKVGFNVPIVIDKDGVIVKGHSRYKAAIKLGMTEVPCIISEADEEANKLDRISDNRVSEFSEWLDEALNHELDMITLDASMLDFPTIELPDFDDDFEIPERETDEERRQRFLKMQEEFEKDAPKVELVTEKQMEKAEQKKETPAPKAKYFKCICEKCGHTMFVTEANMVNED